jgi:hypothetical protein
MNILCLGSGTLGNHLYNSASSFGHHAKLIPGRFLQISDLLSISLDDYDVIYDCLDPSSFDSVANNRRDIFFRNFKFRLSLCNLLVPHLKYIYFSSINLYRESSSTINESSCLLEQYDSLYLSAKFICERVIFALSKNFSICRLPALWHESSSPGTFFGDLLGAYSETITLPPRAGDNHVISFMHYNAVSSFFASQSSISFPKVFNLSSEQWSTRSFLKARVSHCSDNEFGRKVTSLYPQFIIKSPPL